MALSLEEVVDYLDTYLRIDEISDYNDALNGLQVENGGEVVEIVAAVDASQRTIDRVAAECEPGTLLVVHHGLFWDGNKPVTGRRYHRLRALIENDIALYSAHLPLDVHPEVGNNAVLARELGILDPVPFDDYRGTAMGAAGHLIMSRDALAARLAQLLDTRVHVIAGGPETTTRVGLITGGAGGRIASAVEAGLDTFITGEGAHHTTFDALEAGINVLYAGHYATETVGVKALAEHLAGRFGVEWRFHDHPTGL
ncbi:MAG TPA: Nif3-like dinuclear metal center hexameric protein [Gemmatimonadales bacterium]|nr:Nif3-like dinuclear metal center hexameric protein [Gemmatimonadales bacterium]